MKIYFLNPISGKREEIEIQNNITIKDLKRKCKRFSPFGGFFGDFFCNEEILEDYKRVYDYDIEENDLIYCGKLYSGGGPLPTTHICPYGCGRQIPDNYKGCTELLKDIPNYFG